MDETEKSRVVARNPMFELGTQRRKANPVELVWLKSLLDHLPKIFLQKSLSLDPIKKAHFFKKFGQNIITTLPDDTFYSDRPTQIAPSTPFLESKLSTLTWRVDNQVSFETSLEGNRFFWPDTLHSLRMLSEKTFNSSFLKQKLDDMDEVSNVVTFGVTLKRTQFDDFWQGGIDQLVSTAVRSMSKQTFMVAMKIIYKFLREGHPEIRVYSIDKLEEREGVFRNLYNLFEVSCEEDMVRMKVSLNHIGFSVLHTSAGLVYKQLIQGEETKEVTDEDFENYFSSMDATKLLKED